MLACASYAMFMCVCLPCCFASFRLLLLLASVSFRSCEDSLACCSVFFLDLFFSLCGIPGKMTEPGYHYYFCLLLVVSIYSFASMPTSSCQPPTCNQLPCSTTLPTQTVAWLSTLRSALLIALLVAGEDWRCLLHVEVWLGYITLYKCLNEIIYILARVEG